MSEIKPALTAEEWAEGHWDGPGRHISRFTHDGVIVSVQSEAYEAGCATEDMLHAVAAFCLHGQPFGFTREDVLLLRGREPGSDINDTYIYVPLMASLADRIKALLPPEVG